MKKRNIVLIALVALFAIFASSAAAATPAEKILEAMETFPFNEYQLVQAENFLATVELTDAQADEIIACMEELRPYGEKVNFDLDYLVQKDLDEMLVILNKGAAVINCSVKYVRNYDSIWEVNVYNADGVLLETFHSKDPVKQTGFDSTALIAATSVLAVAVVASVVVFRKKSQMNAA